MPPLPANSKQQQNTRNTARYSYSVAGGATQSPGENPAVLVLTWVLRAAPTCLPYLTLICFSQSRRPATTNTASTCNLQLRLHLVFFSALPGAPPAQPALPQSTFIHARGPETRVWDHGGTLAPQSPSDGLHTGTLAQG